MAQRYSQRAPFNDWWYWSECLVKRFQTMADLYRTADEPERAAQIGARAKALKDNCGAVVAEMRNGVKTDAQKAKMKDLEEKAIFHAAEMFRDILAEFPFMSSAIQDFLGLRWDELTWEEPPQEFDAFGNPVEKRKKRGGSGDSRIIELFWGPKARTDEGIRSGKVEDGGLPGILYNLMLAEKTSSNRQPTDYGQFLSQAASQQFIATQAKHERAGVTVNFKPGGGM